MTAAPPWRPRRIVYRLFGPAVLLVVTYLAHFSESGRMGFYEDDQAFAVRAMEWRAADLSRWCWGQVVRYPKPQGRPVGFALGMALPWVGGRFLGGVAGMYAVGFAVVGANAVLFHALLRRTLPDPAAIVGGLAFVLFPADTTRPFLCHAHILAPAVAFTLTACHGWLSGGRRRAAAYGFALLAVLTYETAVLPFAVIPLLARSRWDRSWVRAFAFHLCLLLGLFAVVAITRRVGGESRVTDAAGDARAVLRDVVRGTVVGTATVWRQAGGRWAQGVREAATFARPIVVPAFIVLASTVILSVRRPRLAFPASDGFALLRGLAFAVASAGISYTLAFTHAPWDFAEGRMTSTHLSATVPFAAVVGLIAATLVWAGRTVRWPAAVGPVVAGVVSAAYLAPLLGYARDVQDGYAGIWADRQQFWRNVIDRCPDLSADATVVCDGAVLPPARYIAANSWSDGLVLAEQYQFHAGPVRENESSPLLCCFARAADGTSTWPAAFARDGDRVVWADPPFGRSKGEAVRPGTVILLHVSDLNVVTRDPSPTVAVGGRPFPLHPSPSAGVTQPAFATRPFYPVLTGRRPVTHP